MENGSGWILAAVSVLGLFGGLGLQWVFYERRVTSVESQAEHALQTAAESENKHTDLEDMIDTHRRDVGETIMAMQHKIHEIETWSRDQFVRKDSFEAHISRMEKAQEARDLRLERQLEGIVKRLDDQSKVLMDRRED